MNYVFDIFDELKYKGFMFHSNMLSGGGIAWPSGKPLGYFTTKLAVPDFVTIADSLISVGTIVDPIRNFIGNFY